MTEQDIAYIAIDVRVADALERIATALEQGILEGIASPVAKGQISAFDPYPADLAPADEPAELPAMPLQPVFAPRVGPPKAPVCPVHNTPWRMVPAGVSKKTGNAYSAFWACSTAGCNQRP